MFDPYHKWLGIPPKNQPPNHYVLLGLEPFEADPDVIDMAANKQMAFVRSLATGPHAQASQKLLNEISAARICLLNADKKASYDAQMRQTSSDLLPPLGKLDSLSLPSLTPRPSQQPRPGRAQAPGSAASSKGLAGVIGVAAATVALLVIALVLMRARPQPSEQAASAQAPPVAGPTKADEGRGEAASKQASPNRGQVEAA